MPRDWTEFVVERGPPFEGIPARHLGYLSVWLGGCGSATQAHYDVMNNCFLQMHGRKRFRCWPPTAHVDMCVFPDAHPRARKSRLVIDDALASGSLSPPAVDLTLAPGDALFIPAFWFHHVEVIDDPSSSAGVSVSLNVFSQAALTASVGRMLARAPPPLAKGEFAAFAVALSEALGLGSSFPGRVYDSRYGALGARGSSTAGCPSGDEATLGNSTATVHRGWIESCKSDLEGGPLGRIIERCRAGGAEGSGGAAVGGEQALGELTSSHARGVTEIAAAHLLELVAVRTLGAGEVKHALYEAKCEGGTQGTRTKFRTLPEPVDTKS